LRNSQDNSNVGHSQFLDYSDLANAATAFASQQAASFFSMFAPSP
jgi:hypothetical protein